MRPHPTIKDICLLLLLAAGAIAIEGYHPFVEDAEIYVPGIKQALNPALYPHNQGFFASHAHLTLFPNLIAGSIRLTHIPTEWGLLLWQFAAVFMLLLGCWHLGRLCFSESLARWGGVALVASLLALPVAGTALYIMDEYLNTRSLSAPAVLFILINTVERKFWRAAAWAAFTAAIHPLMAVFGLSYAALVWWMQRVKSRRSAASFPASALLLPLGFFPPVTPAYREVLATRPYFFLQRWHWYEWLGVFAPLALLWWFRRLGRRRDMPLLAQLCAALVIFELFYLAAALVVTIPPQLMRFAELQPMRSLHILYILLFIFSGGLLAQFVLKDRIWGWLLLFVPLCAGMWWSQRSLFPATPHIEWPGAAPHNLWVEAFVWIRGHTPVDAYFVLNPQHMALPGEDQHGFRAIAERSMLADAVKDSGAVTMFPALAETWQQQVRAQSGWNNFKIEDFRRLKAQFGLDWAVIDQPGLSGLDCPFQNHVVRVCRIE